MDDRLKKGARIMENKNCTTCGLYKKESECCYIGQYEQCFNNGEYIHYMPQNVILNHINESPFNEFILPIVTVYFNTIDFPNQYVGRIYNVNHPCKYIVLGDTLEEVRSKIPNWMHRMDREDMDNLNIVEVWL